MVMGETPNYQTLQERKGGHVYRLNLVRPERLNARNATMVEELNDYLERLMTDASIRMMVMRGSGRAYCSGIDIKEFYQRRGLVRPQHRGAGCHRKIVLCALSGRGLGVVSSPFKRVVMNAEPLGWYGTSDFVGKEWQAYEGVYLPLLSDGETVDIILGAVHCVLR